MERTVQQQIVAQSSLKTAADYLKLRTDVKDPSLQMLIGVSMALESYVVTGDTTLVKEIEKQLTR